MERQYPAPAQTMTVPTMSPSGLHAGCRRLGNCWPSIRSVAWIRATYSEPASTTYLLADAGPAGRVAGVATTGVPAPKLRRADAAHTLLHARRPGISAPDRPHGRVRWELAAEGGLTRCSFPLRRAAGSSF
jgi:hypothetical protein